MSDEKKPCGKFVYWWEGEYEGECKLPVGHEPNDIHFDGLSWFDDSNEMVDDPDAPEELRHIAEESA